MNGRTVKPGDVIAKGEIIEKNKIKITKNEYKVLLDEYTKQKNNYAKQ